MDEFLSQIPPDGSPRRLKRIRTTSRTSRTSMTSIPETQFGAASTGTLKTPTLRARSSQSVRPHEDAEPEILSPVPRRHQSQITSETQWLHSPSPSSRPTSPALSPLSARYPHHRGFAPSRAEGSTATSNENGLGKRWLRWMHRNGMKSWVVPCTILASMWVKWCIGLGSYSGQGTPPMFGDYEAQRHWMELTIHLPIREWYTYDLQYWGLDYPPLTAYVSWLCGIVGSWIDPSWFALDSSRGVESPESKVYMRATVLALDTLIYVPAVYYFTRIWHANRSRRTQNLAFMLLLTHPALLLIDFGHFQYNSVMLGLTLLAFNAFAKGHDLVGAVFFVLSLGFKQMALYYAPAIGAYLLGKCIYLGPTHGTQLFIHLALTTLLSFLLLFSPFLPPFAPLSAILDPLTRIFPFGRGLFEDKVANFWCATNVVLKWRTWFGQGALVKLAAGLTAVGFAPAVGGLLVGGWKTAGKDGAGEAKEKEKVKTDANPIPIASLLPHALLTSSMAFFLFSFQVHEKTILVPLLPLGLIMSAASPESGEFEWAALVSNVAMFSMWPLLKKDGLGVQYVAVTLLWNRLIGYNPFRSRPRTPVQFISIAMHAACLALHVLELTTSPPARYPDLFPVLNVLVCTPIFALTWAWSVACGVKANWALGGLGLGAAERKGERRLSTLSTISERTVAEGSGAKAKSLGYAQGKRRSVSVRSASVGVD